MTFFLKKIPRNQACPCGSQKKFKHCHGIDGELYWPPLSSCKIARNIETKEQIRKQKEGLGTPIVSFSFGENNPRVVAVGNKIYTGNWQTFHRFLLDYICFVLGSDWGKSELKKPLTTQHIILQWRQKTCQYLQQNTNNPNGISTAQLIGAIQAYMGLSYNLYLLAHNEELQHRLIERLKRMDQFPGAYYETFVFAWLIKAGFQIDFENEQDRSQSHTECIAIHKETGKKYNIEAKSISRLGAYGATANTTSRYIERSAIDQVARALKKKAAHTRIIFINLALSKDEVINLSWVQKIITMITNKETYFKIDNLPAPEAYIFFTNNPDHYHLEDKPHQKHLLSVGFKIPDFGYGKKVTIEACAKHKDLLQLVSSIAENDQIPSDFPSETIQ